MPTAEMTVQDITSEPAVNAITEAPVPVKYVLRRDGYEVQMLVNPHSSRVRMYWSATDTDTGAPLRLASKLLYGPGIPGIPPELLGFPKFSKVYVLEASNLRAGEVDLAVRSSSGGILGREILAFEVKTSGTYIEIDSL